MFVPECLVDSESALVQVQYIPRNMHTVFALLCFVGVIHWLIFPYQSGLLHWHCGNLTIAPVPAKQPWWIWINTSCEFIMNDCITTTKQSTTKPCAYFLGYIVMYWRRIGNKPPRVKRRCRNEHHTTGSPVQTHRMCFPSNDHNNSLSSLNTQACSAICTSYISLTHICNECMPSSFQYLCDHGKCSILISIHRILLPW